MGVLVFFLVSLVVLVLAAWTAHRLWSRRGFGPQLAAYASQHGLTYLPRDDRQCRTLGYPFGIGRRPRAENVVFGTLGEQRLMAFDHSFEQRWLAGIWLPVRHSVVIVRLPAPLPEMEVVEEGPGDKPSTFLGLDFVVTEDADFNERFRVRAEDPDLAHQVLSRWTQQALLQRPPLRLRLVGAEARSWRKGRLTPAGLEEQLASIAALVDGIPPTVWIDYRRPA